MGNVGAAEVLVILLVGLIVLGPTKLPTAVRQVGRFVSEVRRIGAGFRQELRDVIDEPVNQTKATLAAADPRAAIKRSSSDSTSSKPKTAKPPPTTPAPQASPPTQRRDDPGAPSSGTHDPGAPSSGTHDPGAPSARPDAGFTSDSSARPDAGLTSAEDAES